MTKINEGGPAFPVHKYDGSYNNGMSLRDYFAAQALPIVLEHWGVNRSGANDSVAKETYNIADAMLKAREAQE